jgi:hypothetical protein
MVRQVEEKTEDISKLKKEIEHKLTEFKIQTDKIQTEAEKLLGSLSKKGYRINKEEIKNFMQKFWFVAPTKNQNEWEVAIPVFIPFNIGWFDRVDGGYNVFIINKYTKWFGEEIPTFISHEISIPPAWKISVDGNTVSFSEDLQEKISQKFGEHLSLVEKDKATIKQGHEFNLIAEIIDSGSLPFVPHPISENDLRDSDFVQFWDELEEKYKPLQIFEGKYSYQGEAWNTFQKYGALGIFWGMSFGKTVIGTYIFSRIKGDKALVVPTTTLKEQWEQFFKWNCPRLLNEVEIFTYQGMSRGKWNELRKKEFMLIGFDECLPYSEKIVLANEKLMKIGEVVKKKIKPDVLSLNIKTKKIEAKPITNIFEKEIKETLLEISIKTKERRIKKIKCTEDHKVFIGKNYIEAKNLKVGNKVYILRKGE